MTTLVTKQGENLQRVSFLAIVPGLLRTFGVDPVPVLDSVGLAPDGLDDPNATIPYAAMGRLMDEAAHQTDCAHFGLLVGSRIGTAQLGLLGQLMRSAPTLGVALQDFCSHQHRNSQGGVAYVFKQDRQATLGYTIFEPRMAAVPHINDGAAAAAFNIVNELRGQISASGIQVLLARHRPPDPAAYDAWFGVPLLFSATQTGVRFPLSWLDLPIKGADGGQRGLLEQRVAALWAVGDLDIVTRVRRTLRVALFEGQPSDAAIATQLGLQQRQLHRLLRNEGYNFKRIVNEIRFELARQLLEHTALRLTEISQILGFSHQNAFSRAFIRWAGVSPTEWQADPTAVEPGLRQDE